MQFQLPTPEDIYDLDTDELKQFVSKIQNSINDGSIQDKEKALKIQELCEQEIGERHNIENFGSMLEQNQQQFFDNFEKNQQLTNMNREQQQKQIQQQFDPQNFQAWQDLQLEFEQKEEEQNQNQEIKQNNQQNQNESFEENSQKQENLQDEDEELNENNEKSLNYMQNKQNFSKSKSKNNNQLGMKYKQLAPLNKTPTKNVKVNYNDYDSNNAHLKQFQQTKNNIYVNEIYKPQNIDSNSKSQKQLLNSYDSEKDLNLNKNQNQGYKISQKQKSKTSVFQVLDPFNNNLVEDEKKNNQNSQKVESFLPRIDQKPYQSHSNSNSNSNRKFGNNNRNQRNTFSEIPDNISQYSGNNNNKTLQNNVQFKDDETVYSQTNNTNANETTTTNNSIEIQGYQKFLRKSGQNGNQTSVSQDRGTVQENSSFISRYTNPTANSVKQQYKAKQKKKDMMNEFIKNTLQKARIGNNVKLAGSESQSYKYVPSQSKSPDQPHAKSRFIKLTDNAQPKKIKNQIEEEGNFKNVKSRLKQELEQQKINQQQKIASQNYFSSGKPAFSNKYIPKPKKQEEKSQNKGGNSRRQTSLVNNTSSLKNSSVVKQKSLNEEKMSTVKSGKPPLQNKTNINNNNSNINVQKNNQNRKRTNSVEQNKIKNNENSVKQQFSTQQVQKKDLEGKKVDDLKNDQKKQIQQSNNSNNKKDTKQNDINIKNNIQQENQDIEETIDNQNNDSINIKQVNIEDNQQVQEIQEDIVTSESNIENQNQEQNQLIINNKVINKNNNNKNKNDYSVIEEKIADEEESFNNQEEITNKINKQQLQQNSTIQELKSKKVIQKSQFIKQKQQNNEIKQNDNMQNLIKQDENIQNEQLQNNNIQQVDIQENIQQNQIIQSQENIQNDNQINNSIQIQQENIQKEQNLNQIKINNDIQIENIDNIANDKQQNSEIIQNQIIQKDSQNQQNQNIQDQSNLNIQITNNNDDSIMKSYQDQEQNNKDNNNTIKINIDKKNENNNENNLVSPIINEQDQNQQKQIKSSRPKQLTEQESQELEEYKIKLNQMKNNEQQEDRIAQLTQKFQENEERLQKQRQQQLKKNNCIVKVGDQYVMQELDENEQQNYKKQKQYQEEIRILCKINDQDSPNTKRQKQNLQEMIKQISDPQIQKQMIEKLQKLSQKQSEQQENERKQKEEEDLKIQEQIKLQQEQKNLNKDKDKKQLQQQQNRAKRSASQQKKNQILQQQQQNQESLNQIKSINEKEGNKTDYSQIFKDFRQVFSFFYNRSLNSQVPYSNQQQNQNQVNILNNNQQQHEFMEVLKELLVLYEFYNEKSQDKDFKKLSQFMITPFDVQSSESYYVNDPKQVKIYANRVDISIKKFIDRQIIFQKRMNPNINDLSNQDMSKQGLQDYLLNKDQLLDEKENQNKLQKSDGNKMKFRVVKSKQDSYDIVTRGFMRKNNWEVLPTGKGLRFSWNLLWTWGKPQIEMHKLLVFQKVNHFPGNRNISRKDLIHQNIQKYQKISPTAQKFFDTMPTTFILPKEYVNFSEKFGRDQAIEGNYNYWIVKPIGKSQGKGISVINDISSVVYAEQMIVQKYLKTPLLIDNKKFDMRLYVLVTSYNPLEAFIFKEGFARLSTEEFNLHPDDIKNNQIHLTNFSIQKNFYDPTTMSNFIGGTKISLKMLKSKFQNQWQNIWQQCKDIIVKTLVCVQQEIPNNPNCFELYGFDVIIDNNYNCTVLEVNSSPSFARDFILDDLIKQQLIDDTLDLIGGIDFDRKRLVEILQRRIKEEQEGNSNYGNLEQLNQDLNYLLKGQKIRKYGEMPQNLGDYERICPSPIYDKALKIIKQGRGQSKNNNI